MSEYMGTDSMIALQRSLRARTDEFAANPLLANGGRIMNILDPEQYGWSKVRTAVERDGLVALTMVDKEQTLARLQQEFGEGAECPFWEAFTGKPGDVLPRCAEAIAGIEVPQGWRIESFTHPDDETIHAAQTLNERTGVSPAPAYFLRSEGVASLLTCLYDADGQMAACASGGMRYHRDGPLADWFFAGGVSVSPDHRRRSLGTLVNARLLIDSHQAFAWVRALEQAKAENAASVGMIARCGLRQDAGKVTVVINATGGYVTR